MPPNKPLEKRKKKLLKSPLRHFSFLVFPPLNGLCTINVRVYIRIFGVSPFSPKMTVSLGGQRLMLSNKLEGSIPCLTSAFC